MISETVSAIVEERHHNPRLQVSSRQAYIDQMNALDLDPPKLMDVAVPADRSCGMDMNRAPIAPGQMTETIHKLFPDRDIH